MNLARCHEIKTSSLLISVSLLPKETFSGKCGWGQKWACLSWCPRGLIKPSNFCWGSYLLCCRILYFSFVLLILNTLNEYLNMFTLHLCTVLIPHIFLIIDVLCEIVYFVDKLNLLSSLYWWHKNLICTFLLVLLHFNFNTFIVRSPFDLLFSHCWFEITC